VAVVVVPAIAALAVTDVGIAQAAHSAKETPVQAASLAASTPVVVGPAEPARIPGLGAGTWARIPSTSSQVIVVSGADNPARTVTVALWRRSPTGAWQRTGGPWAGHIGRNGWGKTRVNDGRSPIGVFSLTEAGGTSPAPAGTRMPYDHSAAYTYHSGFGAYVVRIDYNVAAQDMRKTPKDTPAANWSRGSGIWLHVDAATPTDGCTSVPTAAMRTILSRLDPADRPVIVQGPPAFLRA
jgi:L,D-peptidoglycan transpeptidase YkuD (ErfK/YbiS/YcfS/YnhG family)